MKKFFLSLGLILIIFGILIIFLVRQHSKLVQQQKKKLSARQAFLNDLKPLPELKISGVILVSHFNEKENKGPLGEFGSWDKEPNDYTQTCYDSFSPLVKRGDKGYSLRVDYDVDSPNPAYNGIWFKLGGVNLTKYKYLVLWIKGDKKRGFNKFFKIELKNKEGERGVYYLTNIKEDWQEYKIPLNKFMGISHFDKMTELIFTFEDWRFKIKEGTYYIDDIYFTKGKILSEPLCNIYKTARERIPKPDISKLSDKEFLELLERKAFAYFWKETSPETGLTKDKANNFKKDNFKVASIAAVGFALTSYPIGIERGWITKEEGLERTLNTLFFFRDKMKNVHGFFYHFVGMDNGVRVWNSEVSSIDTALFLAGALFAGEYFGGKIKELAQEIYSRVDWNWMLGGSDTLCMGWTPEKGFLPEHWNKYGEEMILYLLAIGSPTHPISKVVWDKIRRPLWNYAGYTCLSSPPLFTHQYSHIWVDFRNKHDRYADYFTSSVNATLANRQFCIDNKENSLTFRKNSWGLTACESPAGYRAYGAPPGYASYDGTVAFTAAGGSIPFAPSECIAALRWMYQNYKDYVWGKYGFVDSFNKDKNWYADIVIGIDQGPILLMSENYLNGFVWKYFMKNEYIRKAMQLAGFKEGKEDLIPEKPVLIVAKYNKGFSEKGDFYKLTPQKTLEYGAITKYPSDLGCNFKVNWDEDNLYFWVKVSDNDVVAQEEAKTLYKQDCVEIYITAAQDKFLYWGDPLHFQLGFAPSGKDKRPLKYAWFQNKDFKEVQLGSELTSQGYEMKIIVPFKILNIKPAPGEEINFSIAVHDFDKKDNTPQCKYNLCFIPHYQKGTQKGFQLARLKLQKR